MRAVQALRSNGEGLAGALYYLQHGTYVPGSASNRGFYRPPLNPSVFESITSWCREVNDTIERIEVKVDFEDGSKHGFKIDSKVGFEIDVKDNIKIDVKDISKHDPKHHPRDDRV